jgi:methylenetetrahydrofolate dehydrogenase (NADP+)/methenyltetrahydrofolate cyclohydrolase
MLTNRKATVTVCHSKTVDLKAECLRAEILIVAVGRPGFITADMVTEGAVVIDVGINRVDEKIVGDVDFDHVSQKSSYITPVPGGCGLMTVACLMENVVKVAKKGIIMT